MLALGVLLVGAFRWGDAAESTRAAALEPGSKPPADPATSGAPGLARPGAEGARPARDPALREALADAPPGPVLCTESATGAPLAGIWLYRDLEPLAGPSATSGELAIEDVDFDAPGAWTLWAKGWVPVVVRATALPTEVAFERAGGSLELRLLGATDQHRMLRSLLKLRRATPSPDGPWAPRLVSQQLDVWVASGLAPGSYNLYVWITFPDGEPRPFSHTAFAVEAGAVTQLAFDLAAPRDAEDQEDDS